MVHSPSPIAHWEGGREGNGLIVTPSKFIKDGDNKILGGYLLNGELYEDDKIITNK
jgi:hypothetical protein